MPTVRCFDYVFSKEVGGGIAYIGDEKPRVRHDEAFRCAFRSFRPPPENNKMNHSDLDEEGDDVASCTDSSDDKSVSDPDDGGDGEDGGDGDGEDADDGNGGDGQDGEGNGGEKHADDREGDDDDAAKLDEHGEPVPPASLVGILVNPELDVDEELERGPVFVPRKRRRTLSSPPPQADVTVPSEENDKGGDDDDDDTSGDGDDDGEGDGDDGDKDEGDGDERTEDLSEPPALV